jgi:hypothetical protein
MVPGSGRPDRRVLFGAFPPRPAPRIVVQSEQETGPGARARLAEWRRRCRAAPTIWVLLDRGPAPTAAPTPRLAAELNIQLLWLPKQWPEWTARDQWWRELKRLVAAHRQAQTVEPLAQLAENWLWELSPQEALRKARWLRLSPDCAVIWQPCKRRSPRRGVKDKWKVR